MPYFGENLDRDVGNDNKVLLREARNVIAQSPPIKERIAAFDDLRDMQGKEFVGLIFNRYIHDKLGDRWSDLERKRLLMKEDMQLVKDAQDESKARTEAVCKLAAQDRVQILLLGSRVRQLEGLSFNLEKYHALLTNIIGYYMPYKEFMRQCADRMNYQNEMQIVHRYQTLSLVKKEYEDSQITQFEELEGEREILMKTKQEGENRNLGLSCKLSSLAEKFKAMEKRNLEFETSLSKEITEASESARSTFRVASGIRKLYESIMKYRNLDATSCDPFEMLEVIGRRLSYMTAALNDFYHLINDGNSDQSSKKIAHRKPHHKKTHFSHKDNDLAEHKDDSVKKHVRISEAPWSPEPSHLMKSDKNSSNLSPSKIEDKNPINLPPIKSSYASNKSENLSKNNATLSKQKNSSINQKNHNNRSLRFPKINNKSSGPLQRSRINDNRNTGSLAGSSRCSKLTAKNNSSTDSSKNSLPNVDRNGSSLTGSLQSSMLSDNSNTSSSAISSCRSKFTVAKKPHAHWR